MKSTLLKFIATVVLSGSATLSAQTFILDDFGSGNATGGVNATTSWFGQISQSATALTVGGTALSDSGWEALNLTLPDLSGYSYLALTAQLSASNAANNIFVTFDAGGPTQTITFTASSFSVGSMTTVYVPITWSIDASMIEAWNIGGGAVPPGTSTPAFRMTFDKLALTTAVPEPSTYAAMAGALALGLAVWRRRSATRA